VKILIADVFPEEYIGKIRELGHEVFYEPDIGVKDLEKRIVDVDVLVVRSTPVTARLVERSDRLSLVIRAGSGVNTIDTEACSRKGIFVSNCPGLNSVAVAELTMAHILAIDRRIPDCVIDLRNGTWNKAKYARTARGLKGLSLGIIGFGNVGREVARRALAFDMKVTAYDPHVDPAVVEMSGVDPCPDLETLCRRSDIITVHVPLTEETRRLIGHEAFGWMKPGTYLVNTSRGGVIDEEAFLEAAREKNIRGGFDVFADEPESKHCPYRSPLAQSPSVYGTHHIGASTRQAQRAVAREVYELLKIYGEGGHVKNCVNLQKDSRAKAVLLVRHYDRVGVLAEVFRILKEENINVEDMENIIFKGEETACARIKINKPLSDIRKLTEDAAVKGNIIRVDMYPL